MPKSQSDVGLLDDKKPRKDDKSSLAESTNGLWEYKTRFDYFKKCISHPQHGDPLPSKKQVVATCVIIILS